jgi:hypothetical protein
MIDLKVRLSMTQREQSEIAVTVAVLGLEYMRASSPKGVPFSMIFYSETYPSYDFTITSASPSSRMKYSVPSSPYLIITSPF